MPARLLPLIETEAAGGYPEGVYPTRQSGRWSLPASVLDAQLMRDVGCVRCPGCQQFVEVPGEDRISTPLFVATCRRCGLEFDWRLSPGKDFLHGATLAWQEYLARGEGVWSYDCCVFCWQTFMEEGPPGVERAGYVTHTPSEIWWVCRRCFEDFGEEMGWRVEPLDDAPG